MNPDSWLTRFTEYASYGEAHPKFVWWSGVSAISGALRRKVWVDHFYYQWSPNFYIIFVAPPGVVAKSTTIDTGMRLLRAVDDVVFGPSITSWQALIKYMGETTTKCVVQGNEFCMSAVSLAISELGIFLDPHDRSQIDNLVNIWDGKLEILDKHTKGQGNDTLENPWLSFISGTTPKWVAENFNEYSLGGGFFSRAIVVYADKKHKLIPFPELCIPEQSEMVRLNLINDLREIATYSGPFTICPDAYEWERNWYETLWSEVTDDTDGRITREQTHLEKLAMVISAAEFDFPNIRSTHLATADEILRATRSDASKIFESVGQSVLSQSAREVVELVTKHGTIEKQRMYRQFFFRKLVYAEYETALESALRAGLINMKNIDGESVLYV